MPSSGYLLVKISSDIVGQENYIDFFLTSISVLILANTLLSFR